MADTLSQNDLDALLVLPSGEEVEKHVASKDESSPGIGVAQADLDVLWGAFGGSTDGNAVVKKKEPTYAGLSQSDLDALWGLAPEEGLEEPTIAGEENPAPGRKNLSQDDIDRLLLGMGK